MDAAIYIPAELAQIQDLIIEKQLRLHVTPEELDILRNWKFIVFYRHLYNTSIHFWGMYGLNWNTCTC